MWKKLKHIVSYKKYAQGIPITAQPQEARLGMKIKGQKRREKKKRKSRRINLSSSEKPIS